MVQEHSPEPDGATVQRDFRTSRRVEANIEASAVGKKKFAWKVSGSI